MMMATCDKRVCPKGRGYLTAAKHTSFVYSHNIFSVCLRLRQSHLLIQNLFTLDDFAVFLRDYLLIAGDTSCPYVCGVYLLREVLCVCLEVYTPVSFKIFVKIFVDVD